MVMVGRRQVGKRAARHLAAIAGHRGGRRAAHIDSLMLRDRDYSTAWTAAADSTVEERMWYGQNWRADVALVMNSYGRPLEKVKYSAYGVAMEMTNLDYNADGVIDPDDAADFIGTPYDWDLDGDTDNADRTGFATDSSNYAGVVPSRGQVSLASIANRKGYAGYEFDGLVERYHVRHRVYVPEMGRWTRRDPIGYVDGMGLYEYVGARAITAKDPSGLCGSCAGNAIADAYVATPAALSVAPNHRCSKTFEMCCGISIKVDWECGNGISTGETCPVTVLKIFRIPGDPKSECVVAFTVGCTHAPQNVPKPQPAAQPPKKWTIKYKDCATNTMTEHSHQCPFNTNPRPNIKWDPVRQCIISVSVDCVQGGLPYLPLNPCPPAIATP